jgi:phosphoglucomutase
LPWRIVAANPARSTTESQEIAANPSPIGSKRRRRRNGRCSEALAPERIEAAELAGEPIESILGKASGNGAPIGGIKVVARRGWFAARPSGTEDIYKTYAESFDGPDHLQRILKEAQAIVDRALSSPPTGSVPSTVA